MSVAVTISLSGCADKSAGRGGRGAGAAAPVIAGKVERKVVPLNLEAVGAVEPSRTASVRSQVTGTLVKINFTEGQDVRQGDILFQIDPRPFQNSLRSAEADLQRIKVQLGTALAQVDRYRALSDSALVSQEQFQAISDSARALQSQQLASEAAAYVTGQTLCVDGGASLTMLPTPQMFADVARRWQEQQQQQQ
jgi:multidrug efflux system membrane fusion protein